MTLNAFQEFIPKDIDNYLETIPVIRNEDEVPEKIKQLGINIRQTIELFHL